MCNKSWEVWCVFCLLLSCSRLDFKLWAWNLLKSLNQAHIPTWTRSKKQFFAAWDAAALQGQLGPAVAVCCTGEGLENDCYIWSLKDTLQCWEMVVFQDKDLRTMTARVDLGCTMGDRSCNGVFALRYFEGGPDWWWVPRSFFECKWQYMKIQLERAKCWEGSGIDLR